ncbi:MAG: 3-dehydroquinate synthase [Kiritimatiellia bacterium]
MKRKTTAATAMPACYRQSFAVPFEYPVYFTRDVFRPSRPLLASAFGPAEQGRPHRLLVYVDDGVAHAMPRLPARIAAYFGGRPEFDLRLPPIVLPGGERAKEGWGAVQHVMTQLGEQRLCRHSYVVVVGGGSLLDAVGFAASLVHRGVRLIRLPTTVLAQNDAGVGVKNGMNEHGMKNFVGTFAPPHAVINDFDFLETIDDVHWQGGISEAFKVALIRDAGFFAFLEKNAARLRARAADAMEELVQRCAILHLEHIRTGNDPFERGAARPLDFGHWAAHKLEAMSGFTIGHGQAVAIGIALDCYYAAEKGLLSARDRDRILRAMRTAGLVLWDDRLALCSRRGRLVILDGLDEFREHLGGQLTITLPDGIGKRVEVHAMDTRVLARGVAWLRPPVQKRLTASRQTA